MSGLWIVYSALIVTILMWSHAFVAIKFCLRSVTPWELVILRHVPPALVFGVYWLVSKNKRILWQMVRSDGWRLFFVGMIAISGYHFALNTGATRITAGTTSLIVGSAPVFTFLVAALLIGERPTWLKAGGIVLAFAGLYVCIRYGSSRAVEVSYMIGALVAMFAPFFSSLYTTLSRPLSQKHGPINTTALTLILGTAPLLATVRPELISKLPSLSAGFWAADLFLGLCNTALAYVFWMFALGRLEATRVATFLYFIPVLGILWGRLYLGEPITGWLVLGGAMIIAGVGLTNRQPAKAPLVSAEPA